MSVDWPTAELSGYRWITLRQSPVGGGFLAEASHFPGDLFTAGDDAVLLIHGYAVHQADASKAYRQFADHLDRPWRRMAIATFWPGDSWETGLGHLNPSLGRTLVAKMSYPAQPERAQNAAKLLAGKIAEAIRARSRLGRNRKLNLHIVAHSMGCRLTLELLDQLEFALRTEEVGLEVPLAALMAPAVPRYMTEGQGVLKSAMSVAGHLHIFHSPDDRILTWFFKAGQALEISFPSGLGNRQPVGTYGADPAGRRAGAKLTNSLTGLDHGDYWKSAEVAEEFNVLMRELHPREAYPGMAPPREIEPRGVDGREAQLRLI
ncbi:MAG: alpha/beta hydrolase [Allosphingosinicella sp.]